MESAFRIVESAFRSGNSAFRSGKCVSVEESAFRIADFGGHCVPPYQCILLPVKLYVQFQDGKFQARTL